jgi:hypothetical protein
MTPEQIIAEIRIVARNLERYPFKSATMAEAGQLAANALRNVANKFEVAA